jgi:tetratricopeptide (TPR) repeat protein
MLANAWRWSEAEPEFRRALELNPNTANVHYFYSLCFLLPENRLDQALEEFHIALSLDPLSPIMNTNYGVILMVARRYPESLAQFQKVIERDPSFSPGHFYLSQLYATTGRFEEAGRELRKATDLQHTPIRGSWSADALGYAHMISSVGTTNGGLPPSDLGLAFALAGDRNKAFEYLGKALSEQDSDLISAVRHPALDSVRSDPRFTKLMRQIRLPE